MLFFSLFNVQCVKCFLKLVKEVFFFSERIFHFSYLEEEGKNSVMQQKTEEKRLKPKKTFGSKQQWDPKTLKSTWSSCILPTTQHSRWPVVI